MSSEEKELKVTNVIKVGNTGKVIIVLNDTDTMELQRDADTIVKLGSAFMIGDYETILKEIYPNYYNKKEEIELLENCDVLKVHGNNIYLKEIDEVSMPQDLAIKIAKDWKEGKDKFIKFWKLLLNNEDERVRNNLFLFMKEWGIEIAESGLLLMVRNANIDTSTMYQQDEIDELVFKARKVWKTKLNKVNIYLDEKNNLHMTRAKSMKIKGVDTSGYTFLSNLQELVDNNGESTNFRSEHTNPDGSYFKFELGEVMSMPRSACDSNQEQVCSTGLHFTSPKWLNNGYFGNTTLLCLVHPADIVAAPIDYQKVRSSSGLPMKIVNWIHHEKKGLIKNPYDLKDWDTSLEQKYIDWRKAQSKLEYNLNDVDNFESDLTNVSKPEIKGKWID